MTDARGSLPAAYFDALYARDPDPWRFASSDYERGKYDETLAALRRRPYKRALEIGCSIGVLTARLAEVCDALLATDVSNQALAAAKARCADQPNVRFELMGFPDQTPSGEFDLIVLSEVLYYLSPDDLDRAADRTMERLAPNGEALLVHWLGETPDYPLTGDEAADRFIARATDGTANQTAPTLTIDRRTRRERYRLDLLSRPR